MGEVASRRDGSYALLRPGTRSLAGAPAYNESGAVADVIRSLRARASLFDVIGVDDGPTDATVERGGERGGSGKRILRVRQPG